MIKNSTKRKCKDGLLTTLTYIFSCIGVIVLFSIIYYVVSNGASSLTTSLISGDYQEQTYNLCTKEVVSEKFEKIDINGGYYSTSFGVGLKDSKDNEGNDVVVIYYIHPSSPFNKLVLKSDQVTSKQIKTGYYINKIIMSGESSSYIYSLSKDGAEKMVSKMDKANYISDVIIKNGGGGIRGSLLTTLALIGLTLVIALPIGIMAAIYLHEYAPDNKFKSIIHIMIDMTSGIPSLIFGFVGALVFIPVLNNLIGSQGGSIMSGALTMTIILLPTIIKNTEDAFSSIPKSFRESSLALGASKNQTIRKVILPNAIPGILTAVLLCIGRIIGESAALIYAIGTYISDSVIINQKSTTLAVHIWSLMQGDNPNYQVSCAISIIILIIVLALSILVKLISKKLNKFEVK